MNGFSEQKLRVIQKLQNLLGHSGEVLNFDSPEGDARLNMEYANSFLLVVEGNQGNYVATSRTSSVSMDILMASLYSKLPANETELIAIYEVGMVAKSDSIKHQPEQDYL